METANVVMKIDDQEVTVGRLTVFTSQCDYRRGRKRGELGYTICSLRFELNFNLREGADNIVTIQSVFNALDEVFNGPEDNLFPFHDLGVRCFGERPVNITAMVTGPLNHPGNFVRARAGDIARLAEEWRRMLCPRELERRQ